MTKSSPALHRCLLDRTSSTNESPVWTRNPQGQDDVRSATPEAPMPIMLDENLGDESCYSGRHRNDIRRKIPGVNTSVGWPDVDVRSN
jgi:hypothetical protein